MSKVLKKDSVLESIYKGDHTKGEIEIISDIETIDADTRKSIGPIGVVYEDRYIRIFKDPVIFPNSKVGSYIRMEGTKVSQTGSAGSAVIAMSEGKILLINIFRHALRSRSLEIPRGFSEGDSDISTAIREVQEETGYSPTKVQLIGTMNPDSGLTSNSVSIYFAELDTEHRSDILDDEGTEDQKFYSKEEIYQLILERKITDSFTLSAIALASVHGFI